MKNQFLKLFQRFKNGAINLFHASKKNICLIICGISIGWFLSLFLNKKYYNNINVFFFINSLLLIIFIGKVKLFKEINYFYNSLLSKENELFLLTTLSIVSLLVTFNFSDDLLITRNIFRILLFIIFIFDFKNYFEFKNKENLEKEILLSFRKNELEYLEKLIEDRNISTILIDDKIGNGKTFLLEQFLDTYNDRKYEIIYLKLPLLKSCEILKKIVMNEILIVLKKNRIPLKKIDLFFQKISSVKTNLFEFNFFTDKSNWDSLKELKENIEKLEFKGKKLLIILDDIEREKNKKKIEDSIIFLGELAEYLKKTGTTFIFLAQYEKIFFLKDKTKYKIDFFEKYFNQRVRLSPLRLEDLKIEDLKILTKKHSKTDIEENELEKNSLFILYLLKALKIGIQKLEIENKIQFNENIRTLDRFLIFFYKNIKGEKIENNSMLIWIYIYKSLDIFLPNFYKNKDTLNQNSFEYFKSLLPNHIISKKIYIKDLLPLFIYNSLEKNLKGYIYFLSIKNTKDMKRKAETLYLNGGLKENKKINSNLELIFEYINGEKIEISDIKKEINFSDIPPLLDHIKSKGNNKNIIKKLFTLNLIFESPIGENLIKIILEIDSIDFLSEEELKSFIYILKKEKFYGITYVDEYNILVNNYSNSNSDKNADLEKIATLKSFFNILTKSKYSSKIFLKDLLFLVKNHIETPSLNSRNSYDDYLEALEKSHEIE